MLLEYQIWQVVSSTILLIARLCPINMPQRFSPLRQFFMVLEYQIWQEVSSAILLICRKVKSLNVQGHDSCGCTLNSVQC